MYAEENLIPFSVWLPSRTALHDVAGPAKKARPVKAGSHNLHYHINNLNIAGRWDCFLRSSHLCAADSED